MILFNKKGILGISLSIFYLLSLSIISSVVYMHQGHYMINVLSVGGFVNLIIPVYIIFSALIDKSISYTMITRLKSRVNIVFFELIQEYLLAFVFICFHAAALIIVSILKYGFQSEISIVFIIEKLSLYLLCLLILTNISYIIKRCNIKYLSSVSYILVYCFLVIEITLINHLNLYLLNTNVYFIFSLITMQGIFPIIVMGIEFIISTVIVFKVSSKSDIL